MNVSRGGLWLSFGVVVALVVLDLWSKSAVFAWLDAGARPASMVFLADTGHWRQTIPFDQPADWWLAFMPSRNPGAAFGQLHEWPWLLVVGRILAVCVLTFLLFRPQPRVVRVALVLVLSGAVGNLYDNLFLEAPPDHPFGEVRDFIDVYFAFKEWHFPTFNVADSCISVGAVLLLLSSFFGEAEEQAEELAPAEAEG